ncbi:MULTISPECIES: hypothetical protein [unclassified Acinetobacter]|uniref:hypothetical protein n=1 Tax=unclassified Acinetobacter TaxID=196816 RepID=UPI001C23539A|nr:MULTISPECIES: hypothetical protein [unclassified Acinetobacter]
MWQALHHTLKNSSADRAPLYLQEATRKMQLTIDRLENRVNLNLFKTDYLE